MTLSDFLRDIQKGNVSLKELKPYLNDLVEIIDTSEKLYKHIDRYCRDIQEEDYEFSSLSHSLYTDFRDIEIKIEKFYNKKETNNHDLYCTCRKCESG